MNKKQFKVEVTETLQRVIEVEADSPKEAISQVKQSYDAADIVLDSNDFIDVTIDLFASSKKTKSTEEIVNFLDKSFGEHNKEFKRCNSIFLDSSFNVESRIDAHNKASQEAHVLSFIYELLSEINGTSIDAEAERLHQLFDK